MSGDNIDRGILGATSKLEQIDSSLWNFNDVEGKAFASESPVYDWKLLSQVNFIKDSN